MSRTNGISVAVCSSREPGGDHRFTMLAATMKRYKYAPNALIEVLHTAQEIYGYLDASLLRTIARGLRLPPSRVFGVASFYHLFTFTPPASHSCVVCTGTACYVKGGEHLAHVVQRFVKELALEDPEQFVSIRQARCLGTCGMAPVVVLDGQVMGSVTEQGLVKCLKGWDGHGS